MGERLGERRLAVTARAAQRRGDGCDRVAFGVEEPRLQGTELSWALYEILRRCRRPELHAQRLALGLQHSDERRLVLGEIEVINLPEPTRQMAQVHETRALDWADVFPLLTRQSNFVANNGAFERSWRDNQDKML
jgi:hypothetical protein